MDERKNINRVYQKLNVWNDAIEMYRLVCKILKDKPFELKKTTSNAIDAAQSISRNIAEGYCRRSIKEYLKHLYISFGSSGELRFRLFSILKAGQISEVEINEFDKLHLKTENELIQLVKALRRKEKQSEWIDKMPTIKTNPVLHFSKTPTNCISNITYQN